MTTQVFVVVRYWRKETETTTNIYN